MWFWILGGAAWAWWFARQSATGPKLIAAPTFLARPRPMSSAARPSTNLATKGATATTHAPPSSVPRTVSAPVPINRSPAAPPSASPSTGGGPPPPPPPASVDVTPIEVMPSPVYEPSPPPRDPGGRNV